MNKEKIQSLVEGSLITAVNVIIFWLSYWFFPIIYIAPLPFVILTYRNGIKIGILSLFISILLTALITTPFTAIFLVLPSGFLGIYLGYGLFKRLTLRMLILGSFLILLLLEIIGIYFSIVAFKMPLEKIVGIDAFREGWKRSLEIANKYLNVSSEEEFVKLQNKFIENLHIFIPYFLIMSTFFQVVLNYVIIEKILKRFKIEAPPLPKVEKFKISKKSLLIIFIPYLFLSILSFPYRDYVLSNLFLILQSLIILNGYIFIWIFLRSFVYSKWLRWIIFIFFILNPLFGSIIFIIGLIDIFFPLREKFLLVKE